MGRKRGEIEEWLRKVVFSGDKEEYIVFIKHRTDEGVVLRPIPGRFIDDLRRGYLYVGEEMIPFHRVVEIRRKNGSIVYRRRLGRKNEAFRSSP